MEEAETLSACALEASGTPRDRARLVAEAIVYAEASDLPSHGLLRVPHLVEQIRFGKLQPAATVTTSTVGDSVFLVDARDTFGYVSADLATSMISGVLEAAGVAIAAISNSHHLGVAGLYPERLAKQGWIGLAISNTFGAIAPIGGSRPLIGNNPLAAAFPRRGSRPVVIDFAPARVARGRILLAAENNSTIPEAWAMDAEGKPTSDARRALLGSLRAIDETKGVVLAMLLDLLVACLTKGSLPGEASSVYSNEGGPPRLGHIIIGLDPKAFGVSDWEAKSRRYVASLEKDGSATRVPGYRRALARERSRRDGIEVSEALFGKLVSLANTQ